MSERTKQDETYLLKKLFEKEKLRKLGIRDCINKWKAENQLFLQPADGLGCLLVCSRNTPIERREGFSSLSVNGGEFFVYFSKFTQNSCCMKDRTAEFQASIESYIQRPSSEPLLPVRGNSARGVAVSPFMKMAAQLGQEINIVSTKLERLATLAKNKSSFEDKPVEIQELTYVIKQDIGRLNQQIAALENYKKEQRAVLSANRHSEEHNNGVVVSLQSNLAKASSSFKDILEVRTSNMQAQRERRQQFSSSATSALLPELSSSADRSSPIVIDMGTSISQMELVRPDTRYLEARSEAIQSIERTISELGSIFQQLTHMVAEQGEMIGRIDDDIENVSFNVEQGEQQLLQYLRRISNDRWTMIKAFAIVIFFFVIFTAFFS